jgi:hypothetical protein
MYILIFKIIVPLATVMSSETFLKNTYQYIWVLLILCVYFFFQFKEISFAYEVLTDPEKKEIYDRHGVKGLKDGGASPSGKSYYCHFHLCFY